MGTVTYKTRSGVVVTEPQKFCQKCGCEVFRNMFPHSVDIGSPRLPMCIPCFRARKQRPKELKKQYKAFLREQLELFA